MVNRSPRRLELRWTPTYRARSRGICIMSAGVRDQAALKTLLAAALTIASGLWIEPALADPQSVTDAAAPEVNCLFDKTCKLPARAPAP
jgi:hypothetical protein